MGRRKQKKRGPTRRLLEQRERWEREMWERYVREGRDGSGAEEFPNPKRNGVALPEVPLAH